MARENWLLAAHHQFDLLGFANSMKTKGFGFREGGNEYPVEKKILPSFHTHSLDSPSFKTCSSPITHHRPIPDFSPRSLTPLSEGSERSSVQIQLPDARCPLSFLGVLKYIRMGTQSLGGY